MISITTTKVAYNGDGANPTFGYPFRILDASDLKAYVDGVLKTYPTDFSVTNVDNDIGGSMTFVVVPPVGINNVVLVRDTPETQLIQLLEGGVGYQNLERLGLDKLMMSIQERIEQIFRAPKVEPWVDIPQPVILPPPGNGQLWGWDTATNVPALFSIATTVSGITFFSTAITAAASTAVLTHSLGSATAKLVSPVANWNAGGPWLISQALNTFTVGFPTPAPGGGGVLTWGAIL